MGLFATSGFRKLSYNYVLFSCTFSGIFRMFVKEIVRIDLFVSKMQASTRASPWSSLTVEAFAMRGRVKAHNAFASAAAVSFCILFASRLLQKLLAPAVFSTNLGLFFLKH